MNDRNVILGLDTSEQKASLCLLKEDKVLCEHSFFSQKQQLERLVPSLQWLLEQNECSLSDISAIGITTGGGSFTGLRLGLSTVKAMAYALNIPVVGVPTLDAMAFGMASQTGLYLPLLDVRRKQVCGALYDVRPAGTEKLNTADDTIKTFLALTFHRLTGYFSCHPSEITSLLSHEQCASRIVVFGSALNTYEETLRRIFLNSIFIMEGRMPIAASAAVYAREKIKNESISPESVFKISLTYSHTP